MPATLSRRIEALEQQAGHHHHTVVVRFVTAGAETPPTHSVVSGSQRWDIQPGEDSDQMLQRATAEVQRNPQGVAVLFAVTT